MTDREPQKRSIIGGAGDAGGTSGTGSTEASGAGAGAGAGAASRAGDQDELLRSEADSRDGRDHENTDAEGLSAGDDSVDDAIGGGSSISGTDGAAARSGRRSSEGTDTGGAAPDPGDPGGMGGVRTQSTTNDHRPPGGVSPIDEDDDSER